MHNRKWTVAIGLAISLFGAQVCSAAGPLVGFWTLHFNDGSRATWSVKNDTTIKYGDVDNYYNAVLYYKGIEVAMQVIAGKVGSTITTRSAGFDCAGYDCNYSGLTGTLETPNIIQGKLVVVGNKVIPKEKFTFTARKN